MPELLVAGQAAQQPGEAHGRADGLRARAGEQFGERAVVGQLHRLAGASGALRDRTAEGLAALHHVLVLDRVLGRAEVGRQVAVEGGVGDLVVHVQPVAQHQELILGHLLDLVCGVATLDVGAERPALDRLAQDRRRRTGAHVLGGGLVRGVELAVVVTAARQVHEVFVAEVGDHLAKARVGAEEVVADVRAVLDGVALELPVDGVVELVQQHAVVVVGEQFVPLRPEDDLDHVPAVAAEHGLELLDDLSVAAYRTIESLQVAVDNEHQVVELLATGQRERPERLRLVALAVAEEGPDAALAGVVDLAVLQVPVESGLIQRGKRAEAHADRRVLPEVGHQPRVRVARQAAAVAADLAAEVVEVVFAESALHEGPRVDAGGCVALEVHVVAGVAVVLAVEEVVEADLVEAGRAGKGRQVPTDAIGMLVGPDHHRRRVPTHERPDSTLDVLVAGEPRFLFARDGVDVWRTDSCRIADLRRPGSIEQLGEEEASAGLAVHIDHCVEGVEPFLRLAGVRVGQLVDEAVEDHGP